MHIAQSIKNTYRPIKKNQGLPFENIYIYIYKKKLVMSKLHKFVVF